MRRKGDMWQEMNDQTSFLPEEEVQQAQLMATDALERLARLEDQLKSQFTSMATYAQIAQQGVDTARAEARADLDREKATLISLIEKVRAESHGDSPRPAFAPPVTGETPKTATPSTPMPSTPTPSTDVSTLARLALLEDNFERLTYQFGQVLRSQEELANSIAMMFEHQLRHNGALAG